MVSLVKRPSSAIERELKQTRPFPTRGGEAAVGLMRTADLLRRLLEQALEPLGVTAQQYNVLRILRGARPEPLPTLEIAERMIERTPGITRLLDRLEAKKLVRRDRCESDRRQVLCTITAAGLDLLRDADAIVSEIESRSLGRLSDVKTRQLIRTLDAIREGHS
ncbi:MAG TPA: MarR family transcriptional regulator [Candidatus Eisenbacteria bacterium]|jgi:DNA-binding MarR family transcriptional regulator